MEGVLYRYFGGQAVTSEDIEFQWRARVFALASLFCAIGLGATVVNQAVHGQVGLALVLGLPAVLILLLPLGVRNGRGFARCSHVLVALAYACMTLLSVARGGLNSQIPMTLALVPLLAGVLSGRRIMSVWAAIVVVTICLLGWVPQWIGVPLLDGFEASGQAFSRYFAPILFTLVTTALILMMLRIQRDALEAARVAERQRVEAERMAEQTAAQRRTEQMAMVGQLAVGVAHEVNNPLSYVVSNVEFAASVLQRADEKKWIDVIEALNDAADGSRRISRIVTQLNAHGRIAEDNVEPVHLRESVETALRIANNQLRHRAKLSRDFQVDPIVEADSNRLTQVFLNLLINATHAIAAGNRDSNTITVTMGIEDSESAPQAFVEISDTGEGIDPEVLPRITEPFFTTKKMGAGTGLGLSISQSIVTRYRGDLEISSVVGEGTTVRVTFPLCAQALRPSHDERPISIAPQLSRVLVIDDDAPVRRGLMGMLPYTTVEASNVADALMIVDEDSSFDAIVCDVMMPDATGVDFYQALERQHPQLLSRVVMLTGGVFDAETSRFLRERSVTVLSKPMLRQDLLDALVQVMPPSALSERELSQSLAANGE